MPLPPTDSPIERQYRPVEIAHLMKVGPKTVLGWLRNPEHPLVGNKIGTQWYVPESHLRKFLNGE